MYFLFVAELQSVIREFHQRISGLEGDKWDLDHAIKMRDYQVTRPPLYFKGYCGALPSTFLQNVVNQIPLQATLWRYFISFHHIILFTSMTSKNHFSFIIKTLSILSEIFMYMSMYVLPVALPFIPVMSY